MVWVPNGPKGGWREPPYTEEEEMEMHRRYDRPMTIYRGQPEFETNP